MSERPLSKREVAGPAWLEYRCAKQVSTGDYEAYLASPHMPGWFWDQELGFDGYGVNILYTMAHLAAENRARRAQREAKAKAPDIGSHKAKAPRSNAPKARGRRLAGKLQHALQAAA